MGYAEYNISNSTNKVISINHNFPSGIIGIYHLYSVSIFWIIRYDAYYNIDVYRYNITFAGTSQTIIMIKNNGFIFVSFQVALVTLTNIESDIVILNSLLSKHVPKIGTVYIIGHARTSGQWSAATYYPITMVINTTSISLRFNTNNIRSCNCIVIEGVYPANTL